MSDMKRCIQCGEEKLAEEIGRSKTHKWEECKRVISPDEYYFEDHDWRDIEYFEEIEAAIQQQDEEGSGPVIVKEPEEFNRFILEAEKKEK